MKIDDLPKILDCVIPNKDPILISSKHGIGKSSIFKQYSNDNGYYFYPLFLSHLEVADLTGMPDRDGLKTIWLVPDFINTIQENSKKGIKTILFLDELNRAQDDVLQCALELVLENKIHSHVLPDDCYICSAINPSGDYNTSELDPALLDRFMYLEVDVDPESFINYSKRKSLSTILTDFINENPNYCHFIANDEMVGSSPRSLEKVSYYLDNHLDNPFLKTMLIGRLGNVVGNELYMFSREYFRIVTAENVHETVVEISDRDFNEQLEIVTDLLKDTEVNQKIKISEMLSKKYDGVGLYVLYVYLNCLNDEILLSCLKRVKENKELYVKLVEMDSVMNNKELFKRAIR